MTYVIAAMPSYTYAVKAKRLLTAGGYPCEIQRSGSSSEGCGWELRIGGDSRRALDLLKSRRIPFSLSGGDEEWS
ncbi:MAG: DUF3343 domain-containing protein [Ruminococcus sp.]|nr:DUF3343 domain-containing protein [Ruminococcus sp.]MBP8592929.1 DUF3343 domain-containing protein [Ruminococcus sp.]MBQ3855192.1 DUF3343 domain-containing protein [Ruminococcus sp.]MBQ8123380.1 DUF3343 domain-containing protein [Ruminococcus sp.]